MTPIQRCVKEKNTSTKPIWIMRQAGRYLPEFREIRLKNPDFVKLCLDENLSSKITLQPIHRFDFDAAIIFSDILMLPYGLGQEVKFQKGLGPRLGELDINKIESINEDEFSKKLNSIYKAIYNISTNPVLKNKDLKLSQFRLYEGDFPDKLWSARYQFQNMFEVPILFYLLCVLHIIFDNYTQTDIILAWGFVFFRVLHFFIRLQNQRDLNIRPRTYTFILSLVCLTIGWIKLIINTNLI